MAKRRKFDEVYGGGYMQKELQKDLERQRLYSENHRLSQDLEYSQHQLRLRKLVYDDFYREQQHKSSQLVKKGLELLARVRETEAEIGALKREIALSRDAAYRQYSYASRLEIENNALKRRLKEAESSSLMIENNALKRRLKEAESSSLTIENNELKRRLKEAESRMYRD